LTQDIPQAGILLDAGQIAVGGVPVLTAGSGRVVLPTSESMGFVIDSLNLAYQALQVFIEEGRETHEAESLRFQEKRGRHEARAREGQVTVDVFLARRLKSAGPRKIIETVACMEWPLPKFIGFILDYRLKGGIELLIELIAEPPAILKGYGFDRKQNTGEARPLLLETLRNEVWDEMKTNKRGHVLSLLDELGREAEPSLARLIASFGTLSTLLRLLIDQVSKKPEREPVEGQLLELLDTLWEFSWGDRFSPLLIQLAKLYSRFGERENDEAIRFLKGWFLTPQEIERWIQASLKTANGGLLKNTSGAPAILLSLGGQRPKGMSFDDYLKQTMVSRTMRSMWGIAETVHEMGAEDDSRRMVKQLLSGTRFIPEEIDIGFLLRAGGNDVREEVQTRLNAGLAALFEKRTRQTYREAEDFGFLSQVSRMEIEGTFGTLTKIAEADPAYRRTVAAVFTEILRDEVLSLALPVYRNAAKWFLATGDAQEKSLAEEFLAKHRSDLSEPVQNTPKPGREIRPIEEEIDHPSPHIRLKAAEALAKARSNSGFPWLKVVEVLKKLLNLPDVERDLLASVQGLLSSRDLAGVEGILIKPREIRARAARVLDELNPGWDREMNLE
jgi:hypothetical protein